MLDVVPTAPIPRPLGGLRRLQRWGQAHPFLFYTVPLAGWITFITWGCLAPPDELPRVSIPQFDKVEHATIYIILGALFLRAWVRTGPVRGRALVAVWLIVSAWGLYIECVQRLTGYRSFELLDAATNAIGAAAGLALWLLLRRRLAPAFPPPDEPAEQPIFTEAAGTLATATPSKESAR